MPVFTPELLQEWTAGHWTRRPAEPITGVANDTRTLRRGQLFTALATGHRDGHDFLAAALAAGASAALVSRPNPDAGLPQLVVTDVLAALQKIAEAHRRAFSGPVVGVTGSCGKTSTKDVLALLLGGSDSVLSTEGNLNNHLGVPLTLARLDPERHRFAVVEAGISAPGEMEPLARMILPDAVVVTMVGPAHLDRLGSIAGVAREKARLAAYLRPQGRAFFPADCLHFDDFRDLSAATVAAERVAALDGQPTPGVARFVVRHDGPTTFLTIADVAASPLQFSLRRTGDGMASNTILSILAALYLGVAPSMIAERLAHWRPGRLRGQWLRAGESLIFLDCYNANPASMADALDSFVAATPPDRPRFYVIGCMEELGPESASLHEMVGRAWQLRPVDRAVVIGGQADAVRRGLLGAGAGASQVDVVRSTDEIRPRVAAFAGSVFIKGSRRYQLEKTIDGLDVSDVAEKEAVC